MEFIFVLLKKKIYTELTDQIQSKKRMIKSIIKKNLDYLLTTNTPNSETRFLISKLFEVISLILLEEIDIDLITLMLSRLHKL